MTTATPATRTLDRPARPPRVAAEANARTSFLVSAVAVTAAVLVLCAVLAVLSIGLVALAEPGAMLDAIRDGFAYLWSGLTGFLGGLVG